MRKAPAVKECVTCHRELSQEKFDYNPLSCDTLADTCTTCKMIPKLSDLSATDLDNILQVVYLEAAAEISNDPDIVLKHRGEFEQRVAKKIQQLNLGIKLPKWIHKSSLAD